MDNPRPEKVAVVEEVRARLGGASAAILTEYRGLGVKDLAVLRRSLRDAGGTYKVYKNTLVRFAARDLGLDEIESLLTGPTAIAFVDGDAVAVAKALRDFARTNPSLVVKGGVLGGTVLSAESATALADVPPREVLLARLAGGLAAPLVQFAGLLQALPRSFAYGLRALIDKGGAGPAEPGAGADPAAGATTDPAGGATTEPAAGPATAAGAAADPAGGAEPAGADPASGATTDAAAGPTTDPDPS